MSDAVAFHKIVARFYSEQIPKTWLRKKTLYYSKDSAPGLQFFLDKNR
ncbi:hypothetical protein D3OALGB2SA_1082 [Olavius algarvensis associated proteobacterium Delta 3]|nr:hypothetical protein D3OALGB2SA_1082 [Olavius algarvensis associated proteobacterium Delta 3]